MSYMKGALARTWLGMVWLRRSVLVFMSPVGRASVLEDVWLVERACEDDDEVDDDVRSDGFVIVVDVEVVVLGCSFDGALTEASGRDSRLLELHPATSAAMVAAQRAAESA
jgi:hypothetical protein